MSARLSLALARHSGTARVSCVSAVSPLALSRTTRSTRLLPAAAPPRPQRRHLAQAQPKVKDASRASSTSDGTSGRSRAVEVDLRPHAVSVRFPTGAVTSFDYFWLRDHCREERSFHPATKQRLVDTYKIPTDIKPEHVEADQKGLSIRWPSSAELGDAYTSFYPWTFLLQHSYEPALADQAELEPATKSKKILWTSDIKDDMPSVEYDEVMSSEQGVYEWVRRIAIYGFSLVMGIPPTPEATEALIRRIAFVRETHYGGFWVFEPVMEHGDLAYSDVLLQAHTDTTYFTDPCGLQLFHLLSPLSSHTGGHNLLVDGFRAASVFKQQYPEYYDLLSHLQIPSHASGTGSKSIPSGVHMRPLVTRPVFEHARNHYVAPGGQVEVEDELVQVRWNADDRGVVGGPGWGEGTMRRWFEALRAWEGVLRSDEAQLWSRMEMGTAVIFDNHRVLHGRSAFKGERRLCGAYVNHDDYRSRLLGLEKQFGGRDERARAGRRAMLDRHGLVSDGSDRGGNVTESAWSEYSV